jgi:hypothetical protein
VQAFSPTKGDHIWTGVLYQGNRRAVCVGRDAGYGRGFHRIVNVCPCHFAASLHEGVPRQCQRYFHPKALSLSTFDDINWNVRGDLGGVFNN